MFVDAMVQIVATLNVGVPSDCKHRGISGPLYTNAETANLETRWICHSGNIAV